MADGLPPTKGELIAALERSGHEALQTLRSLPAQAFTLGRYENGWNAREILAHIASIDWTYKRLLEIPNQPPQPAVGGPPSAQAQGGIDSYNQRQVERRAAASVSELIDELEKNRGDTIAAVRSAPPELLATPIRSAGGAEGPLATVFMNVAVHHLEQHVRDIAGE